MKLKANGIEINYDKQGSGPVVTLSHSLACNLHMWDAEAKALAGRYTVLGFDEELAMHLRRRGLRAKALTDVDQLRLF